MTRLQKKSLGAALILALIIWLLAGCSPARRAHRQAEKAWAKIEKLTKDFPEILDTLKLVTRDTVKTTEFKDKLVFERVLDSAKVDSLAMILCAALDTSKHEKPPGLGKIRSMLSTLGCPEVDLDTTYYILLMNSKDTVQIPVSLYLSYLEGKLTTAISAEPTSLPETHDAINIDFNEPEKSLISNRWFWAWLGTVGILFLLIYWSLSRR